MKGRITGLTVIIVLLFGLVLGQACVHPGAPRERAEHRRRAIPTELRDAASYPRGEILSSNGIVLAQVHPDGRRDVPVAAGVPARAG